MPDFTVNDQGSIVLLMPENDNARVWIDQNIGDDITWWGGAVAIEHRYADDILTGIQRDGLTIE